MQYVFLIRCRAGCKKYVTGLHLVTYFLLPALKHIKTTYCMGKRQFIYFYPTLLLLQNVTKTGFSAYSPTSLLLFANDSIYGNLSG